MAKIKGATSFVLTTMNQLKQAGVGENMPLLISVKQARMISGLQYERFAATTSNVTSTAPVQMEEPVSMTEIV